MDFQYDEDYAFFEDFANKYGIESIEEYDDLMRESKKSIAFKCYAALKGFDDSDQYWEDNMEGMRPYKAIEPFLEWEGMKHIIYVKKLGGYSEYFKQVRKDAKEGSNGYESWLSQQYLEVF